MIKMKKIDYSPSIGFEVDNSYLMSTKHREGYFCPNPEHWDTNHADCPTCQRVQAVIANEKTRILPPNIISVGGVDCKLINEGKNYTVATPFEVRRAKYGVTPKED